MQNGPRQIRITLICVYVLSVAFRDYFDIMSDMRYCSRWEALLEDMTCSGAYVNSIARKAHWPFELLIRRLFGLGTLGT